MQKEEKIEYFINAVALNSLTIRLFSAKEPLLIETLPHEELQEAVKFQKYYKTITPFTIFKNKNEKTYIKYNKQTIDNHRSKYLKLVCYNREELIFMIIKFMGGKAKRKQIIKTGLERGFLSEDIKHLQSMVSMNLGFLIQRGQIVKDEEYGAYLIPSMLDNPNGNNVEYKREIKKIPKIPKISKLKEKKLQPVECVYESYILPPIRSKIILEQSNQHELKRKRPEEVFETNKKIKIN